MPRKIIGAVFVLAAVAAGPGAYAAKNKMTLVEHIGANESIPVYINTGSVSVESQGLMGSECNAPVTAFAELPEEYNAASGAVVEELNKIFKTQAFREADIDDVPKTQTKFFGAVEDWHAAGNPFFARIFLDAEYIQVTHLLEVGSSDNTQVMLTPEDFLAIESGNATGLIPRPAGLPESGPVYDTRLTIGPRVHFYKLVAGKPAPKQVAMASFAFVESESIQHRWCFSHVNAITEHIETDSLVEEMFDAIPGSLNKFAARQWKRYEKANRKKR
ncbi:MAG: hypothetical protein MJA83_03475 [Gammaproteobacteria bacterium]|nr:hypothetical protein [Gammaproteobacteria bacterium]